MLTAKQATWLDSKFFAKVYYFTTNLEDGTDVCYPKELCVGPLAAPVTSAVLWEAGETSGNC